jgi:hypothetical protein
MPDRTAPDPPVPVHRSRPAVIGVFALCALLAGCSSASGPLTILADPGKYQFHSCEQIASQHKHWTGREQELRLLMQRAEQGAGGAIVNLLAYKAEHVAASEEVQVLEHAARSRNCELPGDWRSNAVVR